MKREKSLLLASVHMHAMTTLDRMRTVGRNHWKTHQHPTQCQSTQIQMLKIVASRDWLVSLGGDSTTHTGNPLQHLTTQGKGFPLQRDGFPMFQCSKFWSQVLVLPLSCSEKSLALSSKHSLVEEAYRALAFST